MTDVLTMEHLVKAREALDSKNIPKQGRIVQMHKNAFAEWCRILDLVPSQVKHKVNDNGIIEVGV